MNRFKTFESYTISDRENSDKAIEIIKSFGYRIHGRIAHNSIIFEGDGGGAWGFKTVNGKTYLSYPSNNHNNLIQVSVEKFNEVLKKIKNVSLPIHAISEFLEIVENAIHNDITRIIRFKRRGAKVNRSASENFFVTTILTFKEPFNKRISSITMYEKSDGNYDLIIHGIFPYMIGNNLAFSARKKTYTDFYTDDFLLEIMSIIDINDSKAKEIIEKTRDEPIGSCIQELKNELRGKIASRKFNF